MRAAEPPTQEEPGCVVGRRGGTASHTPHRTPRGGRVPGVRSRLTSPRGGYHPIRRVPAVARVLGAQYLALIVARSFAIAGFFLRRRHSWFRRLLTGSTSRASDEPREAEEPRRAALPEAARLHHGVSKASSRAPRTQAETMPRATAPGAAAARDPGQPPRPPPVVDRWPEKKRAPKMGTSASNRSATSRAA